MLKKGDTYLATSAAFSVGIATVNRIWRRYRETGATSMPPRGGGRRPKILAQDEAEFRKMVESMPDATYVELTVEWRKKSKTKVSRSAVVRKVLGLGFTRKKKSIEASEKLTSKNKSKRSRFLRSVRLVNAEKLVFLDEAGFQAKLSRSHARAPRGKKAIISASTAFSKNFTMVGAVRLTGPVVMRGSEKTMTTKRFLSFLRHDLFPRLCPQDVVILDNLRAHRSKQVRRLARSWNIRIIYLPPYSPEHNPIEQIWGWMKNRIRYRIQRAIHCFRYAVAGAWRKAAQLSYVNLFRHSGYSISPQTI